ncbi:urea active transporter [[Candida] railenensis]|uniref:Urea active transporter n=1 Tax=[Candida] railenensis TaxID=45579 RepID=A0A9P0QWI1_9ASCO|nr:urea active transporter [[Candida] railenensis]
MTDKYILDQGYGYGFALGIGAAFALLMVSISKLLSIYAGEVQSSERFSTASRSVKSGLIASSTVSAWTWPATLLSSGAWAYNTGIMGGFTYGIGGTTQVLLFAFLAIQIKKNSPGCHTVAQLIQVRFGKAGHWVYLCYCVATNVLISSLLLLGGSQGFSETTGMHIIAASFLLPLGVVCYTLFGGLKATFISDWIHTVIIYGIICAAAFVIYGSSSLIGSPSKMYDLLIEADELFPSSGGNSYLSFFNKQQILLTWTVTVGGLSSVFGDPGYSQRAIASDAKSVFSGYVLGGACWLVIPWALGTSAGLACLALLNNPASFTYPNALTAAEVDAGMPVIYGLAAIFGKSGAAAGLVMLFMSVTSATSAELIAFSSIFTYDVYQTYVKPDASGKRLVTIAHGSVVFFGLFMACLAVVFNYVGVTVGWLLSFLGIILSPEVSAITLAIFWKKMSKESLIIGAPLGTLTGIACWIGATYAYNDGVVNRTTVMANEATVIGNFTSLFSSLFYYIVISYIKPADFDFKTFETSFHAGDDADEKEQAAMTTKKEDAGILKKQSIITAVLNIILVIGAYVIVPCAYYGSRYVFSKAYFTSWIVIMLIWLLVAATYIVVFPLWQGRHSIYAIVSHATSLIGKTKSESTSDASSSNSTGVEEVDLLSEPKV